VAAVLGLAFAAVFVVGSFSSPVPATPTPYLVPFGLLLGGIGLAFLAVSVALVSDSTFVALTRRELAAYFFSPIAYIVLLGVALGTAIGYMLFLDIMQERDVVMEPILQDYFAGSLIGPLMIPFLVPALTMRLLSEERRTGTLEVLLTAPVSEAAVVLSKFLACWLFFMLCWVPTGLYLIGLRVEGGQPFDYRPLLTFYLAVGASGAAFIAIGLVFSALTRNQIVAAVLTFVVMLALMVVQWSEVFTFVGPAVKAALKRLAYWDLWVASLRGQLPVRDVLIQLSIAVFGLFLIGRLTPPAMLESPTTSVPGSSPGRAPGGVESRDSTLVSFEKSRRASFSVEKFHVTKNAPTPTSTMATTRTSLPSGPTAWACRMRRAWRRTSSRSRPQCMSPSRFGSVFLGLRGSMAVRVLAVVRRAKSSAGCDSRSFRTACRFAVPSLDV
jgi:hypothetical protein